MERTTTLYDRHMKAGARMAPFAGFMMPIQYPSGIIAEHTAVRTTVGLFDVSHMGEFLVDGKGAQEYLQRLVCNDISDLNANECHYSPILNENGGIIDDVLIAKLHDGLYAMIVNASNEAKDFSWMQSKIFGDVALYNISRGISSIALQGPRSADILSRLMESDEIPARYYSFFSWVSVAGIASFVSRTGYTGEHGVEI
ncbi:MAG: glycine cleavage system aminomethyltransferase GcvT, partial [Oscillospiraceae bacterium]|nr:glycine cleavage system aminomethyltransferase GcvT [Oscillospiraceae bacterium]